METELQVCNRDALKEFCAAYISAHRERWPTDEIDLATSFIEYFQIPPLIQFTALAAFAAQNNIELIEDDIPGELLGVNISFNDKRIISVSRRVDHAGFKSHTVLHEVREIIEGEFHALGVSTADSAELEDRADEFAFAAYLLSTRDILKGFIQKASRIEAKWHRRLYLGVIVLSAVVFVLYSFLGAFGPRMFTSYLPEPFLPAPQRLRRARIS